MVIPSSYTASRTPIRSRTLKTTLKCPSISKGQHSWVGDVIVLTGEAVMEENVSKVDPAYEEKYHQAIIEF
jgi:hypothetical protein